ncbi:hypothetical protein [uncultured Helicobacter sp.]|uniref:hypothetical protein n=1 Tax=uncultured Helicobacter sp. TaxID=175537 RepID=UPI0027DBFFCA|nr:hypothetical protein [uncultured Helicobacter sp.]
MIHIVLVNTDPMVAKLVEATARRTDIPILNYKSLDELDPTKISKDCFFFIDEGVIAGQEELAQKIASSFLSCFLYAKTKLDGFKYVIKKPFLPTQILDIVQDELKQLNYDPTLRSEVSQDDLEPLEAESTQDETNNKTNATKDEITTDTKESSKAKAPNQSALEESLDLDSFNLNEADFLKDSQATSDTNNNDDSLDLGDIAPNLDMLNFESADLDKMNSAQNTSDTSDEEMMLDIEKSKLEQTDDEDDMSDLVEGEFDENLANAQLTETQLAKTQLEGTQEDKLEDKMLEEDTQQGLEDAINHTDLDLGEDLDLATHKMLDSLEEKTKDLKQVDIAKEIDSNVGHTNANEEATISNEVNRADKDENIGEKEDKKVDEMADKASQTDKTTEPSIDDLGDLADINLEDIDFSSELLQKSSDEPSTLHDDTSSDISHAALDDISHNTPQETLDDVPHKAESTESKATESGILDKNDIDEVKRLLQETQSVGTQSDSMQSRVQDDKHSQNDQATLSQDVQNSQDFDVFDTGSQESSQNLDSTPESMPEGLDFSDVPPEDKNLSEPIVDDLHISMHNEPTEPQDQHSDISETKAESTIDSKAESSAESQNSSSQQTRDIQDIQDFGDLEEGAGSASSGDNSSEDDSNSAISASDTSSDGKKSENAKNSQDIADKSHSSADFASDSTSSQTESTESTNDFLSLSERDIGMALGEEIPEESHDTHDTQDTFANASDKESSIPSDSVVSTQLDSVQSDSTQVPSPLAQSDSAQIKDTSIHGEDLVAHLLANKSEDQIRALLHGAQVTININFPSQK